MKLCITFNFHLLSCFGEKLVVGAQITNQMNLTNPCTYKHLRRMMKLRTKFYCNTFSNFGETTVNPYEKRVLRDRITNPITFFFNHSY